MCATDCLSLCVPAALVQLSQKQIDVRAMQAGGGSKKARGGGGGGGSSSSDAAAALALRQNKALPITSFFSRAQQ